MTRVSAARCTAKCKDGLTIVRCRTLQGHCATVVSPSAARGRQQRKSHRACRPRAGPRTTCEEENPHPKDGCRPRARPEDPSRRMPVDRRWMRGRFRALGSSPRATTETGEGKERRERNGRQSPGGAHPLLSASSSGLTRGPIATGAARKASVEPAEPGPRVTLGLDPRAEGDMKGKRIVKGRERRSRPRWRPAAPTVRARLVPTVWLRPVCGGARRRRVRQGRTRASTACPAPGWPARLPHPTRV